MSELSRTIQAGTSQVAQAMGGLATLRARKKQEAKQTWRDMGDSLREVGATIRAHKTMAEAKAAEDEIVAIEGADGLALGDPEKRLVSLGAVKVTRPQSAAYLGAKRREAWEQFNDVVQRKRNEAELSKLERDAEDQRLQRTSIREVVAQHSLGDPVLDGLALAGAMDSKTYMNIVTQKRLEEKADADIRIKEETEKRLAKTAADREAGLQRRFEAKRVAEDANFAAKQKQLQGQHADRMAGAAETRQIARSRLNAQMTNAQNALALRAWATDTSNAIRQGMMQVGIYREQVDATIGQLRQELARSKIDKELAASTLWNEDDDPGRPALLKAIEDTDADIDDLMEDLEALKVKLPSMPVLPPAPVPQSSGAAAFAGAQASGSGGPPPARGVDLTLKTEFDGFPIERQKALLQQMSPEERAKVGR